jgi:hypothetical protein
MLHGKQLALADGAASLSAGRLRENELTIR